MGLNVATDQKLYIARCIEQVDMDKADFSGFHYSQPLGSCDTG